MHRLGMILFVALVGLIVGCETPSTAAGKVVPYVAASYNAGLDDSKGDFVVYLSEGKQSGPSIRNAVVTLDGAAAPWSQYGYYHIWPLTGAVAGSEHTLRITHATAFDPIEVKLTAPSGPPVGVTIANAPDWTVPGDPALAVSYSVSPVDSWPSSGTVVWTKAYDAFYTLKIGSPRRPSGTAAVTCVLPAGYAVYTGFSVRNQVQAPIPGATGDSFFSVDGDQVSYYGFDPRTLPAYRANLELAYDGASWTASAYFYDSGYVAKQAPMAVSIAGKTLAPESASYPNDFRVTWTGPALAEGSTVVYSFTDPAGNKVDGNAVWHSIDLPVPASQPPKDAIGSATSLTFPAPAGGWPAGARLFLRVQQDATHAYWTSAYGTGSTPIVFEQIAGYIFATAQSISVKGAVETQVPLPGYRGILRLVGPGVSW